MSLQKTKKSKKSSSAGVNHRSYQPRRPAHKRFFLHPMTIMVILVAGVLFAGYTYKALADSYTVTAEVEAAALTQGAYITNPTNNQSFNTDTIEVDGTCPTASYIKLNDNNSFVGVAWCLQDNTFQIQTQLYYGDNILQAQDYNVTDEAGPVTPSVTAIYQSVASIAPSGSTSGASTTTSTSSQATAATSPPLLLTTDYQFQTAVVANVFSWNLDLSGGATPYNVTVNWGDGTSTNYVFNTDPIFTITHTYASPGYFPVIVKAVDAHHLSRIVQLAALIKTSSKSGSDVFVPGSTTPATCVKNSTLSNCPSLKQSSSSSSGPSAILHLFSHVKTWVWISWSTYTVIVLMMISFWLGEREEDYRIFHKRLRPAHRHR